MADSGGTISADIIPVRDEVDLFDALDTIKPRVLDDSEASQSSIPGGGR